MQTVPNPMIIFDGKSFAEKKRESLKPRIEELKQKGIKPKLVSVLVGDNQGSVFYTNLKKKTAESLGIIFEIVNFDENSKVDSIKNKITELGANDSVYGIMVQMPLPQNLKGNQEEIISLISPNKDVDGLLPDGPFLHPTAAAIIAAINESGKDKNSIVAVIGATGMVGRSLTKELKKQNYSVIECNSKTHDLGEETRKADIVVSVTGRQGILKKEMLKTGAAVIDVGYPNPDANINVREVASFITPVPGGIGPVTLGSLMENLVLACENSLSR